MPNPSHQRPVFASATAGQAVTPSDSTELSFLALWIGTGGNVAIKHTEGGDTITYKNIPSGSVLAVAGVRVMAATTAANIVAMRW